MNSAPTISSRTQRTRARTSPSGGRLSAITLGTVSAVRHSP
nr:hypothetical protein [Sphingomonas changnyeongensis]